MTAAIVELTLRAALGRRRTLLLALLAAVPVAVAIVVRLGGSTSDGGRLTADLLDALVVRTVLPLVAVVFGTGVLGSELEDGTAIYLLVKPIERWRIVVTKLAVAAGLTVALVIPATLAAGMVVGGGRGGELAAVGYTLAVGVGAIVYGAVFVALSVVTSRALIVGLVYTLLWEGVLAGLFAGTQLLSIRRYVLAIADGLSGRGGAGGASAVAALDAPTAALLAAVVLAVAFVVATRALESWEVRRAE